jgi:hypothetical protein
LQPLPLPWQLLPWHEDRAELLPWHDDPWQELPLQLLLLRLKNERTPWNKPLPLQLPLQLLPWQLVLAVLEALVPWQLLPWQPALLLSRLKRSRKKPLNWAVSGEVERAVIIIRVYMRGSPLWNVGNLSGC